MDWIIITLYCRYVAYSTDTAGYSCYLWLYVAIMYACNISGCVARHSHSLPSLTWPDPIPHRGVFTCSISAPLGQVITPLCDNRVWPRKVTVCHCHITSVTWYAIVFTPPYEFKDCWCLIVSYVCMLVVVLTEHTHMVYTCLQHMIVVRWLQQFTWKWLPQECGP